MLWKLSWSSSDLQTDDEYDDEEEEEEEVKVSEMILARRKGPGSNISCSAVPPSIIPKHAVAIRWNVMDNKTQV